MFTFELSVYVSSKHVHVNCPICCLWGRCQLGITVLYSLCMWPNGNRLDIYKNRREIKLCLLCWVVYVYIDPLYPSVCPSIHLSLSIYLSIYPSSCLLVCLSVCMCVQILERIRGNILWYLFSNLCRKRFRHWSLITAWQSVPVPVQHSRNSVVIKIRSLQNKKYVRIVVKE